MKPRGVSATSPPASDQKKPRAARPNKGGEGEGKKKGRRKLPEAAPANRKKL